MRINVTSNIKEFEKDLLWHEKKSMPFVTASALTWTVQAVQKAIILRIPRIFNVTKKWWLKQQPTGIKIKPANYKKINPFAEVYTKAHWGLRQEEGGIKTPYTGAHILVPTKAVPKYGRKAGGAAKVIAGKRIVKHNGSPIITLKSGKKVIARRKEKKRRDIETMYHVVTRAVINARWGFKMTAKAQALRHFPRELKKAYAYAVKHRR